MVPVLKTGLGLNLAGVQIPHSPPNGDLKVELVYD